MKPLNNSLKRAQVNKDKTTTIAIMAIAAIFLVAGIMVSRAYWNQATYLSKVADKKEVARDQLKENIDSVDKLRESYNEFVSKNPNLIGGSIEGDTVKNGDNAKIILDALPSEYDFPATVSSVEGMVSAYEIGSISGSDDSVAQSTTSVNEPYVEIPLSVEFTSTYDEHKQAIQIFKKSIRPFKILYMELTGTNEELNTTLRMVTYYQPGSGLEINTEEVK